MQRLLSLILTAAVLVHTTFGCCAHHAHSSEVGCGEALSGCVDSSPCSGHDGHGKRVHGEHPEPTSAVSLNTPDDGDHEHSHDGTRRCEGSKCSFARTESSSPAYSLDADAFLAASAFPLVPIVDAIHAPIAGAAFQPDAHSGAPHRHLVLAVLLI